MKNSKVISSEASPGRAQSDKPAPALSSVYLYFSSGCNLACRHCWIDPEFSAQGNPATDLPLDKITAALEECIPLGLGHVKITGGEPFIREDIFGLLDYLVSKKLNITIETNATLIKEKEARAIKNAGVSQVSVSIDAPTESLHEELRQVKGSFKAAVEGVKHLKEAGVKNLQIIMCLWRNNAHALMDMAYFTKDLGANSLKINPITPSYRSDKMREDSLLFSVREIIEIYQKLSPDFQQSGIKVLFDIPPAFFSLEDFRKDRPGACGIKNLLGIIADGSISICGIGKVVDKLVLGRIGKDVIADIWKDNPVLKQIREEIPRKMEGVCGKCIFRFYCLGKCRAMVFYETENLLAPFSVCQQAYEQGLFPLGRLIS